ncbi:MAG: type I-E CRISPR-associated protein Cse2/CasB [Spiribacter salinus]|uniref:Type I-E CRISPR-associated protein Cse2/CasB n=1 Tax=Spiribacter salinus TaxID=1335746 RepID=A0A540VQN2_9GAMM|nr:MAG: type I-E CRISPR-associated protein Cse2/CasB [Spiribacter salinus]
MSEQTIHYHALRDTERRQAVFAWWQRLAGTTDHHEDTDDGGQGPDRAARAVLRRAQSPEDALLTEGFRRLWFSLPEAARSARMMPAWGCVAVVLSQVRQHRADKEFAAALGERLEPASDKPVFSELRFRQLQQSRTGEELLRRLRRAVHLLDNRVHVLSLADGILQWHQERTGQPAYQPERRLAVRWANAYFTQITTYQKSA